VESLEEWREKMNLEKMTLVGHSLGGYLSAVYALRYPERVERLILLSPAGVPASKDTSVPAEELNQTRSLPGSPPGELEPLPATSGRIEEIKQEQVAEKKKDSWQRRLVNTQILAVVSLLTTHSNRTLGRPRLGVWALTIRCIAWLESLGTNASGVIFYAPVPLSRRRADSRSTRIYSEYFPCQRIWRVRVFASSCLWSSSPSATGASDRSGQNPCDIRLRGPRLGAPLFSFASRTWD
jgi:pimeloyl-ACP methyl ester carboxylesterase